MKVLLRLMLRELRTVRATSFLAALAVGVAAVVLVAGLGDSLSRAIRLEARPILGADVAVRTNGALPSLEVPSEVVRLDTVDLLTMVAAPSAAGPGRSLLAEVKAVDPTWPFYGAPTLSVGTGLGDLLGDDGVVVDPALLERLGLTVGATLRVGSSPFEVRATVVREPGRLPSGLSAGPRVFVSRAGLARAGLGEQGARITRRALFHVPDEAAAGALAASLKEQVGTRATVETWSDAQPTAQRTIERTTSWLGLVALLSLLVGGVGVAQATRAWMARRLDALAVQRTLGLTSGELAAVALGQTALLALAGSLAGVALGTAGMGVVPSLFAGLLPPEAVVPWQPAAAARGVALGVGMALLFAARPLLAAVRVPPLRVLRRDVEPVEDSLLTHAAWAGGLAAGVFGLAWVQAGDALIAGLFVGGLAGVAGLGWLATAATAGALGGLAHRAPRWWLRHGLAALSRPGAGLRPAVVSLGLGVLVVLTTVLVEGRLYAQIAQEFPASAPSAFLLDVQPDQRAAVEATLAAHGAANTRGAPMIVARLLAVDGTPVDDLARAASADDRWQLTREQRLSYQPSFPADNTLVAGEPFRADVPGELSIEERYAEGLGAKLGSVLRFDVQGVPMDLRVTSIRAVAWESFNMNFFLLVEPGVLEGAPQSVLVTTQVPAEAEPGLQDELAEAFPNVTLLSVRSALAQARGLLEKLAWGIRAVGGFTAFAGVAILASGVAADASRRGREVALMKTLGTTRRGVVAVFALEYAVLGLLAGALGTLGALGVSWGLVTRLLGLSWRTDGLALAGAVGLTGVLCALVGVVANARALRVRPAEVLRGD